MMPQAMSHMLYSGGRPTQFGRLMEELGITSITSRSPQAKGRIERLWGTFRGKEDVKAEASSPH